MNKNFLIGLLTERCGTMSLAALLSSQPGIKVVHEYQAGPFPRNFSKGGINKKFKSLSHSNRDIAL